jgi:hypothetical protein
MVVSGAPFRLARSRATAWVVLAGLVLLAMYAWLLGPAETSATLAAALAAGALGLDVRRGSGAFTPMLPLLLVTLTSLTFPAWLGLTSIPTTFGASRESNVASTVAFSGFVVVATVTYLLARGRAPPPPPP